MSTINETLEQGLSCLRAVQTELKADKNIGLSADVLRAILALDMRYKEFCWGFDDDDGVERGTTYKDEHGISIEFYIEAESWHEISKAFRQWIAEHPNWKEELNVQIADAFDYD